VKTISIIPVGHNHMEVLGPLSAVLEDVFQCSCTVGPRQQISPAAFNVERSQFLASRILDDMKSRLSAGAERTLGVADVDLYVPDLNFVFGVTDTNSRVAIISLCRLREEFYGLERDEDLFMGRVAKEAIHELGHSLGLAHCQNPLCVMSFSNSLGDADKKGKDFCPDCQRLLPA